MLHEQEGWRVCGPPSSSLGCDFRELFSIVLGCPELYLDMLLICLTVGSPLASQGVLRYEKCAYVPLLVFIVEKEYDRNFEDIERTLGEILSLFYKKLNLWTIVFVSPLLIIYSDFLVHFALSSQEVHFVYFQCTYWRLMFLMRLVCYLSKNSFPIPYAMENKNSTYLYDGKSNRITCIKNLFPKSKKDHL
jgi:hypothetical protein